MHLRLPSLVYMKGGLILLDLERDEDMKNLFSTNSLSVLKDFTPHTHLSDVQKSNRNRSLIDKIEEESMKNRCMNGLRSDCADKIGRVT